MKTRLFYLIAALLIIFSIIFSYQKLATYATSDLHSDHTVEELYLPKSHLIQAVSFGYQNVLARVIWFNTISYFGKHYQGDHDYRWLSHMCNLVIDLDPHAGSTYEFCALMLAWEAGSLQQSNRILMRMSQEFSDSWRPEYLLGINYYFFAKDNYSARDYFIAASKKPGAPVFLSRLAAKKIAKLESPETAINFIQSLIASAKDPSQKQALEKQLIDLRKKLDNDSPSNKN